MMVSTKGRYALRVLADMAEHRTTDYVPLKEIAARQEISEKYLENIVKTLVQDGILTGLRGKGGGYRMNVPPDKCTVGRVLRLTEGTLAPIACLDPKSPPCGRVADCRTLPMWQGLSDVINEYLDRYTIADLVRMDEPGNDCVI